MKDLPLVMTIIIKRVALQSLSKGDLLPIFYHFIYVQLLIRTRNKPVMSVLVDHKAIEGC